MTHEKCRVCGFRPKFVFVGKIFNEISIKYFSCKNCGYIQTEHPYWLSKAYESPINSSDTGILVRNLRNRGIVLATLLVLCGVNIKNSSVLDSSGGYGILVRLLRDVGIDAWWSDPYAENIFTPSFCDSEDEIYDLVTSFEAFEHYVEPLISFHAIQCRAASLLISTELYPESNPSPDKWDYFGLDHGQHIGFYKKNTLQYMANKYQLNLYSYGNCYHLFTTKKINYPLWLLLMRISSALPCVMGRLTSGKIDSDTKVARSQSVNHNV